MKTVMGGGKRKARMRLRAVPIRTVAWLSP